MTEDFLQFIWQNSLFNSHNLHSTEGEIIEIVHVGFSNKNAGPDFYDSKIRVGEQLWAGTVEIHLKSSDWIKHNHSTDKAYSNVILHVVAEHDSEVEYLKKNNIPTLVLNFNIELYNKYMALITNKGPIPCSDFLPEINDFYIKSWQNRLLIERIERKTRDVIDLYNQNQKSLEETFYQFLFRNFGFKVNSLPFEMLARSLPYKYISKQKDNLLQIEALLFGQAGFLDEKCEDEYFQLLKREYLYLKQKFNLEPIKKHLWKFLRLRPVNFPTIRIAQLAAVLHKNIHLASTIIELQDISKVFDIFDVEVSPYWLNHYSFCKESKKLSKKIGRQSLNGIMINTVSVFLFSYGVISQKEMYKEKALELLEKIVPEKNNIIDKWNTTIIKSQNSFETQALLELYNEYCKKGKCLNCNIGGKIIIKEKYN